MKANDLYELPTDARPRERFESVGPKNLSTNELLAILLRTGTREMDVLQLATTLLNYFGDLHALKMASIEELMEIRGIGRTKAIELKSAIELGSRLAQAKQPKLALLNASDKAGQWIATELRDAYQENLLALYLNTKNELIKQRIIFRGGLNHSVAHPREIFREAVRVSAARVILGHNHPSGNLEPSKADIDFTERVAECGSLMGIELLDHFIVGEGKFLSLREEGYIE